MLPRCPTLYMTAIQSKIFKEGARVIVLPAADLKKLASADVFQLAHWACERLAVFASHHAQVLLQVNAKVEVGHLFTCVACVKHDATVNHTGGHIIPDNKVM